MIKQLITLGDSWPAGAELSRPRLHSFPILIGKYLNIESINLATQGTSADQALYKLINVSLPSNTLVLFCLTGILRSMNIDGDHTKEIHPMSDTPASMAYYKYIHSNQLDNFNRIRNILAAQQYCQMLGCKILFVNNWDPTPEHRAINKSLFYNKTLTEILNINPRPDDTNADWALINHEYITPNQWHPNINGHSIIAKELSNWIKEKLNDKSLS